MGIEGMSMIRCLPAHSVICWFYEDQLSAVQRQLWLSLNSLASMIVVQRMFTSSLNYTESLLNVNIQSVEDKI